MSVKPRRKPPYRHILVATDGTERSARAVRTATDLAQDFKAHLTAVHVVAPYSAGALVEFAPIGAPPSEAEFRGIVERRGRAMLRRAAAGARRARVPVDTALVTSDAPAEAIVDAAREKGCDLIVVATSNPVGLQRLVLGSVASEVLLRAHAPVLVCR
jgi:nucleotide-binding universal stress UspA family protein